MKDGARLTLLQINDIHAYLEPHPELFWQGGQPVYRTAGGLARLAGLISHARADNPGGVLLGDGGDTFHGTYLAVQTKGMALVPVLNALHPDAMTAHWEFAYAPEGVQRLAERLDYPLLAINIFKDSSGEAAFPGTRMVERGGVQIGIIGIAAHIVGKIMPERFHHGLKFTLGKDELPGAIAEVRAQGAELVVLISHLGFPQDIQLAQDVPGIDVLLSAHTHNRIRKPVRVGNTLLIQSGSHGSFLGHLELSFEGGQISDYRHRLITVDESLPADPQVQALVDEAAGPYRQELSEVVGQTAVGLDRGQNMDSTMDRLILEALLEQTGAEIAISNGWRYGAPVPPGPVRLNDLYNMVPMNPPLETVELSGEELQDMLEQNLEHTYARNPYEQMGGYLKRAAGLRVLFKIENPPGQRIQEIFVGTERVDPGRVYRAAFITEQGVPARYGTNRQQQDLRMVDALRAYLAKHSPFDSTAGSSFLAV